jgi:hypothetical protein
MPQEGFPEMGFRDISLLIGVLLSASVANSLASVLAVGGYTALVVDLSWLLHSQSLSREAAAAVLLAHFQPTPDTISAAISLALFSSKACVAKLLAQLLKRGSAAPKLVLVSERASSTFDPLVLFFAILTSMRFRSPLKAREAALRKATGNNVQVLETCAGRVASGQLNLMQAPFKTCDLVSAAYVLMVFCCFSFTHKYAAQAVRSRCSFSIPRFASGWF